MISCGSTRISATVARWCRRSLEAVTFLSDLVDNASGDDVPIATLLRKVKVVAARLGNVALEEWVDHELMGYPPEAELPDYRASRHVEVQGHFAGPVGSGLQNAPIPSIGFPKEFREGPLFTIEFREPISELEKLSQSAEPLRAMWPADAVAWTNQLINRGDVHLYEYMGLQQAFRLISSHSIGAIVDTVRTRILNLALSLEAVSPDAGLPDAPPADVGALERVVMNVYGGNVAVQSSHFKQEITMPAVGDLQALFVALNHAGVPSDDQEALRDALVADEGEGAGPRKAVGRRVREWVGGLALQGAGAAGKGAAGAGGSLALRALASYFGLDLH